MNPRRKRGHSPPVVTVEINNGDDGPLPKVTKRRRGRPKSIPASVEFSITRPRSPNLDEIRKALGENLPFAATSAHSTPHAESTTFDEDGSPPPSSDKPANPDTETQSAPNKVCIL